MDFGEGIDFGTIKTATNVVGNITKVCKRYQFTIWINKKYMYYSCPSLEYAEKTSLLFTPIE